MRSPTPAPPTTSARRRGPVNSRHGRTLVETAIILNVVVMLVMSVCEYGRLIMVKQLMDNAAREGARYAVVSTGSTSGVTTAQVQAYVLTFMAGQSTTPPPTVLVYQMDPTTGANLGAWTSAAFGSTIAVQIDLNFQPAVPLVMPSAVHLTARSSMCSEAN